MVCAWSTFAGGRIELARADPGARAHLQIAVERFTVLELPLEAARARLSLAAAMASDTPAAAANEARLAFDECARLGARRDTDAAAALLRRLGRGSARPRIAGLLTKREAEVLMLLGDGLSNAQIAGRLTIGAHGGDRRQHPGEAWPAQPQRGRCLRRARAGRRSVAG